VDVRTTGGFWHLVSVDSITTGKVPTFDEAETALVKAEWMAEQRAESRRKTFEAMKARYGIVLPATQAR
jgi:peptidyl-prolyl cis-trans isomerase C